jgi:FtsH-binding integral membrane protein
MGKYQRNVRVEEKRKTIHPIWRGIGCLLIIIIPVMSYAIALITFPLFYKAGLVPYALLGSLQVPTWMWYSPYVAGFIQSIINQPNLKALLVLAFVYILAMGGIMSLVYAVIYRRLGPSRYGPKDAPPMKGRKVKKYTR